MCFILHDYGAVFTNDVTSAGHAVVIVLGRGELGDICARHYRSFSQSLYGRPGHSLRKLCPGPRGMAILGEARISSFIDDFEVLEASRQWSAQVSAAFEGLFAIDLPFVAGRGFSKVTHVKRSSNVMQIGSAILCATLGCTTWSSMKACKDNQTCLVIKLRSQAEFNCEHRCCRYSWED